MMQPLPLEAQGSCPPPFLRPRHSPQLGQQLPPPDTADQAFPARRLQVAAPPRGRDQQAAWAEIRGRQPPCQAWLERAEALQGLGAPWGMGWGGGGSSSGFCVGPTFLLCDPEQVTYLI